MLRYSTVILFHFVANFCLFVCLFLFFFLSFFFFFWCVLLLFVLVKLTISRNQKFLT